MKHLTMADKSLLVGDDVADLLVEYATLLGQQQTADHVDLRAVGIDGGEVTATFLLNSGTTIMTESTASSLPEPDNAKAAQYLHGRIVALQGRTAADPEVIAGRGVWNEAPGA